MTKLFKLNVYLCTMWEKLNKKQLSCVEFSRYKLIFFHLKTGQLLTALYALVIND